MYHSGLIIAAVLFLSFGQLYADTPANCTYEDARGYWEFHESTRDSWRNENCEGFVPTRKVYVKLEFPNVAVDKLGNIGTWTIIYNQGIEVELNYRKYFAFFAYSQKGQHVVSYCHETGPYGWSHDLLGHNWACFKGHKVSDWDTDKNNVLMLQANNVGKVHQQKPLLFENINLKAYLGEEFAAQINSEDKGWTARAYPEFQSLSNADLVRMAGGRGSTVVHRPKPAAKNYVLAKELNLLPKSFDWRDVDGVNYVSPVRNQGRCGSCYSFASMAMLEARVRILSNNTEQPIFSPQNVVDCSRYSQGCDGGFPYLIAGKYAQDYGVIPDACYPYKGANGQCRAINASMHGCNEKTYTYSYKYIGGYYGACNEDLIMLDLVKNGPVAVGFEVYPDFMSYHGGVYSHEKKKSHTYSFDPFEITNHAVLVVGYGETDAGEKYWIVKNSWGTNWGLKGYFWIRRGTDECGIESLAVSAIPMP